MSRVDYHRTPSQSAELILRDGFRDATDSYMTRREYSGVWLSDRVLDANEGVWGAVVLALDISENELAPYEWVVDILVNRFGAPKVHDVDAEMESLGGRE